MGSAPLLLPVAVNGKEGPPGDSPGGEVVGWLVQETCKCLLLPPPLPAFLEDYLGDSGFLTAWALSGEHHLEGGDACLGDKCSGGGLPLGGAPGLLSGG